MALGIALLVVCLICILYQNGYAILNFKAALMYMGYPQWGKQKKLYPGQLCCLQRFYQAGGAPFAIRTISVCFFLPDHKRNRIGGDLYRPEGAYCAFE